MDTAAEALFAEHGYRATTIRTIAEHAGVASQTVYAVFTSKRGILLELVARAKASADIATTYETLMSDVDPTRRLALTVEITERWSRAAAGLVELVRDEADNDPEVADAWPTPPTWPGPWRAPTCTGSS
jgi:AcrR family transcriptional regulator